MIQATKKEEFIAKYFSHLLKCRNCGSRSWEIKWFGGTTISHQECKICGYAFYHSFMQQLNNQIVRDMFWDYP